MPNSTLNPTFPQKLYFLMDLETRDIITWLPHGLAFKVMDYKRFSDETIPKYFRHTKLTSFQRQLNLYGFRRVTKGEDQGAYFHPKFQRGRADLVAEIRRLPGKPSNSYEYGQSSSGKSTGSAKDNGEDSLSLTSPSSSSKRNLSETDIPYQQMDSKLTYEELKSSYANQLATQTQNGMPAMKMSKLSMNVGFGRGHNAQEFYPQQGYVRWIPAPVPGPTAHIACENCLRNGSCGGMIVQHQHQHAIMVPIDTQFMASQQNFQQNMCYEPPTFEELSTNHKAEMFQLNNMCQTTTCSHLQNIVHQQIKSESSQSNDFTLHNGNMNNHLDNNNNHNNNYNNNNTDNEFSSNSTTSSSLHTESFDKLWRTDPIHGGHIDDSELNLDFDTLCADLNDPDSAIDFATVECLQDLLSC